MNFLHFSGICTLSTTAFLIVVDVYRSHPYGYHRPRSFLLTYFPVLVIRLLGWLALLHFMYVRTRVQRSQRNTLIRLLNERKTTQYGKDHGFVNIHEVADFRSSHPLTTYKHYEPYFERAIQGERNVIASAEVVYVAITSGTTGKNKRFPVTKRIFEKSASLFMAVSLIVLRSYESGLLRTVLDTAVPKEKDVLPTGVRVGPFSAMVDKHASTPPEAGAIYDEATTMYLHALFTLRDPDVGRLDFSFVAAARSLLATMENHWPQICADIESGTLTCPIADADTKAKLTAHLTPDPARARHLRREFGKGFQDIFPRVWRHVKFCNMLRSGPLAAQAKAFSRRYLGGVRVISGMHLSTEGFYGINLKPGVYETDRYTFSPSEAFYEFIPLDEVEKDNPTVKLMHEVGKSKSRIRL